VRILFTSPVLEHPAAGGPQLRIENSIKALSRLVEIDLVSRSPLVLTGGRAALDFFSGFAAETHVAPGALRLSANRYVRKAQRILRGLAERDVIVDAEFLVRHARRRGINIIWFGYGNISFPLIRRVKAMAAELKLICDTDSVWSRFILRELPYAGWLRRARIERAGRRKEAQERQWVELCDATTAVSEVDAAYYREKASRPERVHIFSNAIDLSTYENRPPPAPGLRKPCLYLAGTFGHAHSPMDVAARWVVEEVLPRVRQRIANAHLYIVGTGSDRMWGHLRDPGITVTGKLPSVLPYLCHADVALVPLKFESGTRFKILEAGACGVPVVSTTLGAEGLPVADGREVLLADEPDAFADAVVRVIEDRALGARLAAACRAMVHSRYSIDTLEGEARSILGSLQ
jgi:glycosyltransferase involved in cell wall biosynthesis